MRTATLSLLALLVVTWGCDTTITKSQVTGAERAVTTARNELQVARDSQEPMADYIGFLEGGSFNHKYALMISPEDIKGLGRKAFLPYSFPAKEFYKKLGGTLTVKEIKQVQVLHSNRLLMRLFIKGSKISVNMKGSMYKAHVKKIKAGIEAGMIVDVIVTVQLRNGSLLARARADSVKLLKNNSSTYTSNIQSAINGKLSKMSWTVGLPDKNPARPASVLSTENHIVVLYD